MAANEVNEVTTLNHNHPLYLQVSDASGVVLIPIKLTGQENYALWSRSMKLALKKKEKLGFVNGSCAKGDYKGALEKQWENTISHQNLLWFEIATLKQGTDSVTPYYSKLRDLWFELDVMIPSCGCNYEDLTSYVEHLISQRLLQFLMGLNESFGNNRSNILARIPVVTVNKVYAIAAQEDRQRALEVMDKTRDALTLLVGRTQGYKSKPKKSVPPGIICDHCGFKGHFKADCYRLVGYHLDFKSKRKGTNDFKCDFKPANAHLTKNADDFPNSGLFNGKVLGIGKEKEGMYILKESIKSTINAVVSENADAKLWHLRLGHPSTGIMQDIKSLKHFSDKNMSHNCEICPLAKQCRLKFPVSNSKTLRVFELIHVDVWGSYSKPTPNRKNYFVTIVDDHSRYTWICLIHYKSEFIVVLKYFIALIRNQFDLFVKVLRYDNGAEFFNSSVIDFLASHDPPTTCAEPIVLKQLVEMNTIVSAPTQSPDTHGPKT
ncbi:uncharacterized protein LOC129894684 [Solanum dulcamara]|uniref:uncharacterized protein LOC129894684 n=1 Tax=Solanum dulcamara TaxID=45834 RepID=UPI0024863538|nr:uncharacterized protein LOC129894684 [Solanum dulcamara]